MKVAAPYNIVYIISVTVVLSNFVSTEDTFFSNPDFLCDNGHSIKATQHNDGVDDCGDSSDESDDPLVISIGCNQNRSEYYNSIEGNFMNSGHVFITSVSVCEYPRLLIPLEMYQAYIFFMCEGRYDQIYRMDRTGQKFENISLPGKRIQAMAIDQITSNVYIVESGRIQMCDINFIACSTLPGKRAINVAFSSQTGSLYWVEKVNDTEWRTATSRRDGSGERNIGRSRAPIEFITVDQKSHDLYWLLLKPRKIIYSHNYTTKAREPLVANDFSLDDVDAFVVNGPRNIVWTAKSKARVQACIIDGDSSTAAAHNALIGRNIVLYTGLQGITPEKLEEKKVCADVRCSHLCTYVSETEYTCFCGDSLEQKIVNPHNGFCEGSTLVTARRIENERAISQLIWPSPTRGMTQFSSDLEHGNELWLYDSKVVDSVQSFSKLGQLYFPNVTSFSALTYDSVQGRLLFAVTGQQGIYAYTLGQAQPLLLVPEADQITVLEFDDWGNNIYWISSSNNGSVNVASCVTGKKVTLITSRTLIIPVGLALFPEMGLMFVLVQMRDSTILEHYTMDGDYETAVSSFFFWNRSMSLSLHVMRNERILLVADHQALAIHYSEVNSTTAEFKRKTIQTSLESASFWSKADLGSRAFALAEKTDQPSLFKIAAVIPAVESNRSECRTENGGCQNVCFRIPAPLNKTCSSNHSEEEGPSTTGRALLPVPVLITRGIKGGSEDDEERTESNLEPSAADVTSTPTNALKEPDVKTRETPEQVHGFTASAFIGLLLLLAFLLLVAVIILLITLIILCRLAVSQRKMSSERECMQLKSFKFNRINNTPN